MISSIISAYLLTGCIYTLSIFLPLLTYCPNEDTPVSIRNAIRRLKYETPIPGFVVFMVVLWLPMEMNFIWNNYIARKAPPEE